MLSRTTFTTACYTHTHSSGQIKSQHWRNNTWWALSVTSDLHLFLEGKISPRDIKSSHQLHRHVLPAAVTSWLASFSKQFHILVRNMRHHIAYLPVEVLHCLQENTPVETDQWVELMWSLLWSVMYAQRYLCIYNCVCALLFLL